MPSQFSSPLAAALAPDLLQRFLSYVRFGTQSQVDRERSPSTPGQLELAGALVVELRQLGLGDAELDEHGYVFATLESELENAPTIGLIAHLDTSPEASGRGVEPIVHRDYDGRVILLPRAGTKLDPESMPLMLAKLGHDLVSSSGDTLLGADDKAGIATIMAALQYLVEHPEAPRPRLRIGFTPDEEIGEGATLFDLDRFGARCAYTVDGSDPGEIGVESFTAIEVRIAIEGVNVHPGLASGRMVNALSIATELVAELPQDRLTPATTAGREGFVHPIALSAAVDHAELRFWVRDFEEALLAEHVKLLRDLAERVVGGHPGAQLRFDEIRQYRNMRDYLARDPEVVPALEQALAREALTPNRVAMRGGTDGSRLSEFGLPTPDLFCGAYECHSVREWTSVQDMAASAATIVRLAEVWAGVER